MSTHVRSSIYKCIPEWPNWNDCFTFNENTSYCLLTFLILQEFCSSVNQKTFSKSSCHICHLLSRSGSFSSHSLPLMWLLSSARRLRNHQLAICGCYLLATPPFIPVEPLHDLLSLWVPFIASGTLLYATLLYFTVFRHIGTGFVLLKVTCRLVHT